MLSRTIHLLKPFRNTSSFTRNMTGLAGLLSKRYSEEEYPDMRGKTAIVTGGTAGIGRRIARGLAVAGAKGRQAPARFNLQS